MPHANRNKTLSRFSNSCAYVHSMFETTTENKLSEKKVFGTSRELEFQPWRLLLASQTSCMNVIIVWFVFFCWFCCADSIDVTTKYVTGFECNKCDFGPWLSMIANHAIMEMSSPNINFQSPIFPSSLSLYHNCNALPCSSYVRNVIISGFYPDKYSHTVPMNTKYSI